MKSEREDEQKFSSLPMLRKKSRLNLIKTNNIRLLVNKNV